MRPSCHGKFPLEEGDGRKAGMLTPRPSAASASLPLPRPRQAQAQRQRQLWCGRSTVHSGSRAPGFPGNKLTHVPRPEATPLASPFGRRLKTPSTIQTAMRKALLQALTLTLKVARPMA